MASAATKSGRAIATARGGDRYIVGPVAKALQVLVAICSEREAVGLNDLVAITGLPKTTVFRYVSTLRSEGLIETTGNGERYRASLGLWLLGQTAGVYENLRSTCLPVMLSLQRQFNETVNLGALRGRQVVYLEIVESERSLRMQAQVGAQDPLHSTALGKALLAHMPESKWSAYLGNRMQRFTENTITDRGQLMKQLREIKESGIAFDRGENEEGALCLAVPLFAEAKVPIAALSISAPASRLQGTIADSVAAALKASATAIGERLRPSRLGHTLVKRIGTTRGAL
jgi:DNA-binding IclR family transcriptional regulator